MSRIFVYFLLLICMPIMAQNTQVKTAYDVEYRDLISMLNLEKYSLAIQKASTILKEGTSFYEPEVRYWRAYSAMKLFNPDAEDLYTDFLTRYPEHPFKNKASYDMGLFHYNAKHYEIAIPLFENCKTNLNEEDQIDRDFKLAYCYFIIKDYKKASALFNNLKKSDHPYFYAANYYAGFCNFKNGAYEDAIKDLKKAEENEEYRILIPVMKMNIYYKQKKYSEMLKYVDELVKEGITIKNKDEFDMLTAEAYYNLNNYKEALSIYENLISVVEFTGDTLYRYGYAQYKNGLHLQAIKSFEQVNGSQKLMQYAAYYLGMSYLQLENKTYALTMFKLAASTDDSLLKPASLFYQGKINFELGNYSDAISSLKNLFKKYPNSEFNDEGSEILSESLLNSNNHQEAVIYIESIKKRSNRINAAYQKVTYYYGIDLFNNEHYDLALSYFIKSAQYKFDKPIYSAVAFWKGEAYSLKNKYDNAIESYKLSDRSCADCYHKMLYGRGYAYFNSKKYDLALADFEEFMKESSFVKDSVNYFDSMIRLADCYYVTKRYTEGVKMYDNLLNSGRVLDMDYVIYQKAVILGIQGDVPEAQKMYDLLMKRFPESRFFDNALYQKAELNFEHGYYSLAVEGFSNAITQRPNSVLIPQLLMQRALAYKNLKNYTASMEDYQRIMKDFPTHEVSGKALRGMQEVMSKDNTLQQMVDSLDRNETNHNPEKENIDFDGAKDLLYAENYSASIVKFEKFIEKYPYSGNVFDARYYLADATYKSGDLDKALAIMETVVTEKKCNSMNKAIIRCAEISNTKLEYRKSLNYSTLLLDKITTKKEQNLAWAMKVESYLGLKIYDSTEYFAKMIIKSGKVTPSSHNKAHLFLSKSYIEQSKIEQAKNSLLELINNGSDEYCAEGTLLFSKILTNEGMYKNALSNLFYLNQQFVNYPNWIQKAKLAISYNYIKMGEIFQAKANLKFLIEDKSTINSVALEAKKMLDSIQTQK